MERPYEESGKRRRARRMAMVLGALAIGFYVAFILMRHFYG